MSEKMKFKFTDSPEQRKRLISELREIKKTKSPLMPALQAAQGIYGYLPIEVQKVVSEELNVPLQEIYGVTTFYSQFKLVPSGKYTIGVCLGTACYVKGSGEVFEKLKEVLGIDSGGTTADRKFTLDATRCIGCCGLAPVMTVGDDVYGKLTKDEVEDILKKYE